MAWKSGQSYSGDLRSRILAAIDGGNSAKSVGQQFQVSVSYIYKALGRRAATGETEARPQRNRQKVGRFAVTSTSTRISGLSNAATTKIVPAGRMS